MAEFIPSAIPGYEEAVERECLIRDASFFGSIEAVAGFKLVPMSLERWLLLSLAKSPFLYGEVPSPEALTQFLWLTSTKWNRDLKGWRLFRLRCWFLFRNIERVQTIVAGCRRYVADTFQDRPPRGRGNETPYFSHGASFLYFFMARGYTREEVLRGVSLKELFQILKVAKAEESEEPLCNPSDSIVAHALRN